LVSASVWVSVMVLVSVVVLGSVSVRGAATARWAMVSAWVAMPVSVRQRTIASVLPVLRFLSCCLAARQAGEVEARNSCYRRPSLVACCLRWERCSRVSCLA
jgi:hypothetical protein